jgi:hypothetical protein
MARPARLDDAEPRSTAKSSFRIAREFLFYRRSTKPGNQSALPAMPERTRVKPSRPDSRLNPVSGQVYLPLLIVSAELPILELQLLMSKISDGRHERR